MILETIPDVNRLTAAQKLQLVSELWDDLAAHPAQVPVTVDQITELDRRMAAFRTDPSKVTSWTEIQQRLSAKSSNGE
jgi:putative addiction module component (TIGR02574 family)